MESYILIIKIIDLNFSFIKDYCSKGDKNRKFYFVKYLF